MIINRKYKWRDWNKIKNELTRTVLGRDFTYFKVECDGDKFIVDIWEPIEIGWKFLAR